ncbi:MFS transporter [Corynebacterium hansenii]|uniref:MFS transporter n=1 Tax=Corynebacterium hansenii TaxID=394964 RepID=A0ABV7ZP49_9CORY|nr:MFS transporter [Corynebacterium hansenii]WJY99245.1 putative transporter [Corynebacterium hansenii]
MTDRRRIGGDIWALSIATFINRATGFLTLFAAIFFTGTGMSPETVVLSLSVLGVAGVSGSLLGGRLADRFGKTAVLVASSLVNAGLFAVLAIIDHSLTLWVVGIAAMSALASQVFYGPSMAVVAESSEGRDRVTRFAFYRIFINVGAIVAPALVGFLGRDRFDMLFWFSAIGSVLVPVILLAGIRSRRTDTDGGESTEAAAGHGDGEPSAPTPRLRAALLLVYVAMGLAMVVYAQHQSAVPLRLESEPNGVRLYALLLIINPVFVIAVEYPLSHFTKRMPASIALAVGTTIMGAGVAMAVGFAEVPALVIVGWLLFSLGECIFAPMSNTYVAELSPKAAQSRSQGRLAAFQAVGIAMGPGLGSWMLLVLGGAAWSGFLAMTVVCAGLVLAAHAAYAGAKKNLNPGIAH